MSTNNFDFDLIGQIERDLGPGRRYRRWTVFRCPFHHPDRHPSFAVTNGDGRGPHWRCFSAACGKHGSLVMWFEEYHQMSREEALEAVKGKIREPILDNLNYPAGPKWQERAWKLVEWAQSNLWEEPGSCAIDWPVIDEVTGELVTRKLSALDWLLSRGVSAQTMKIWKIGYIPAGPYGGGWREKAEKWGLKGEVFIAQGILIPCIIGDDIWYLKIRRPKMKPHKYSQVRGGKPALYLAQSLEGQEAVIFCEGELDALLLWQEVGDLAGVVTLGSAAAEFSVANWGLYLIHTQRRYLAYDADQAGQAGSDKLAWLRPQQLEIPQLKPGDKDLTDFHQSGGDLRSLVISQMGIDQASGKSQESLQEAL